ncbi:MAG: hypothetical protein JWM85_1152, partial [Acidimicrobiaceae bacterium]|nr:hypothetical protein [Acidimicrobiaceae bacterium]
AERSIHPVAQLPHMLRVRNHMDQPEVGDLGCAVREALAPLEESITPGMSVALTAGSRGIADLVGVLQATGEWLRGRGAEPFVVPAMGSHAGATADGQRAMLEHLGVSEKTVGMQVRSSMATVVLGHLEDGLEVHLDANAAGADAILLINRVKPHTDFDADIESGLAKMCAIGLGKREGAERLHASGSWNLGRLIPAVAKRIVKEANVLGGVGIVENAFHRTARVAFVEPDGIGADAEASLLAEARSLLGVLPFDDLDVLVVDEIGKDISGTGLDTNVIGRSGVARTPPRRPTISVITVHRLSEGSDGNGLGMGLADLVPLTLLDQLDLGATYVNALTATTGGIRRSRLPMVLGTDRDVVAGALRMCGESDPKAVRLVRIASTLAPHELLASTALRDEIAADDSLEVLGEAELMGFCEDGSLAAWS